MKRILQTSLLSLITFLLVSCFPEKNVPGPSEVIAPVSDTTRIREGSLIYALPMTVFTIKVECERTIELPGPYARYAEELIGLSNVIMSESEHWTVKRISVSSHEEVDPSAFFVIESRSIFITNILSLKKEGLLLDINPERTYKNDGYINDKEFNINQFRSYDLGSDEYFTSRTDTAYRRVSVNNQYIRIPYIVERKKQLTDDQLAEKAARRLMDIRDGKVLILTGEATVFPQSNAPIDELNRMEKQYLELFIGKELTDTLTFTYSFTPEKTNAGQNIALFRFSELTGPEDQSSKSGIPVTVLLQPLKKTAEVTGLHLDMPDNTGQVNDRLYYRMPDVVDMKLVMGNDILYNSRKLIYQFGEIMQLPSNYLIGK